MRKSSIVLLYAIAILLSVSDALACGDKFLVPSRGTRFERPRPERQASILLYASPGSELARRLTTLPVVDALRNAGYRPTVTTMAAEFASIARQQQWDLIVIDISDLSMINSGAARSTPRIVPVTYTLTGKAWNQAKREHPYIVNAPNRVRMFVDAVDAAVDGSRERR